MDEPTPQWQRRDEWSQWADQRWQPAGYGTSQGSDPAPGAWPPPPAPPVAPARRRRGGRAITAGIVAAVAVAGVAVGFGTRGALVSGSGSVGSASQVDPNSGSGNGSDGGGFGGFGGLGGGLGNGSGGSGSGGSDGASSATGSATTKQQVGVVDIDTVLGYQSARAAGTGIVLSSSGEVLTNNHVVRGSTKITVTVVSTGKTYQATVVGTDPTDDVAVIQLSGASGLQTANLSSSTVSVGDAVTAVGNAGGTGGTPSAATGVVTATDQTITATDDDGSNPEQLTGLIETNADVQAGDSGGPLYGSSDKVIGMDTAASASGAIQTATAQGYAIPIGKAVSVAKAIENGEASSTIHLGYPAFLGIEVSTSRFGLGVTGAPVGGVIAGTPAANAGLAAGDAITGINGTTISSGSDLTAALATHKAGDSVKVTWTDSAGQSHSATITLISGPAD
jgi:S1-C subfamily serine protease